MLTLFTVEALAEYRNGAWPIPVITTVAYSVGAVQLPRLTGLFQQGKGAEALDAWRVGAAKAARVREEARDEAVRRLEQPAGAPPVRPLRAGGLYR